MLPESTRSQTILKLALPIIGAMLSQSLINLIDAALVGALGEVALAGVGIGGYAMFLVTALLFGLSSSVQAQTARRHGENNRPRRAIALHAGLLIALCVALPLTALCLWQAPRLLTLITQQADVQSVAVEYFRWRVIALLPVAMIFCFRGFWSGIQQTGIYLRIILLMHVVNVATSIGLIHGIGLPRLGAPGAGAGTAIALFFGLALWVYHSRSHVGPGVEAWQWPSRKDVSTTLRLAIPHSLQQVWFAGGYAVLFWILGLIGTASVAVGHVLVNLSLLLILPGVGLGLAAMSLVGQALGRDTPDDAHRWGWDVVHVAWACLALLALPMLLFPEAILRLFLHDADLLALGRLPLQLTALMIVLDAAALVLGQALLGAGANRTVMAVTLCSQWLLFLPLAWWIGAIHDHGLLGVWWVQLGYRCLNSLWFVLIWQRRRWQMVSL
ncbi:MATE family efflux transporter [Halomonas sp. McH1-25]|uniref:MATE family efflux transporter n=1 Tax=unclassified Halomonas TaxID=2609666 RepID=UPI001EF5CEAA|nr:MULTISPECIES: MATE family efflux transporter [unclassified Halomonas]MCG7598452.1 MATE family efflux transporter [Halomonas sp. McH1-25]MCP1343467.1 MATE family efflux transporter [Halomonas sp. FL8]MCP1361381.1 MATE family efflux transporter [Halomonas sp. BBD45]